MTVGPVAAVMVSDSGEVDAVWLAESETWNTNPVAVPAAVGVPEITPLELTVNPAGNVPAVLAHE